MTWVTCKRHMIDGHGCAPGDIQRAIGVDEGDAPNPGIDTAIEIDLAPTSIVDGILVMDELFQERAVEADVFDADLFQVRIGVYFPVVLGIDIGVEGFIEANAIDMDFSNAVLFTDFEPFCPELSAKGIRRTWGEKLIDCGSALHIHNNPLAHSERGTVCDCKPECFAAGAFGDRRKVREDVLRGLKLNI